MSSAIASLAAMCFPSVGTLPETSRATNLDKTKHVAYKAALVCFLHEFPGQGEDFTGKSRKMMRMQVRRRLTVYKFAACS